MRAEPPDETGSLAVEWALVTATVAVPLGTLGLAAVRLLEIFFYRVAGVIALPVP